MVPRVYTSLGNAVSEILGNMFAGQIKIVYLLLLYCIVVRTYDDTSHVIRNDSYTQTKLKSDSEISEKTVTANDNDSRELLWWIKDTIVEQVNFAHKWVLKMFLDESYEIVERSFNEMPSSLNSQSSQLPLSVQESNNRSKDQEIDLLRNKANLTQSNAEPELSKETTTNAKDSIQISLLSSMQFSLQKMISQWLNDISNSMLAENVLKNELDALEKGRQSISQFFSRMRKLKRLLKWRYDNVYSRNTIAKNKREIFQPSLKNQSLMLVNKSYNKPRVQETKDDDDIIEPMILVSKLVQKNAQIKGASGIPANVQDYKSQISQLRSHQWQSMVNQWTNTTAPLNITKICEDIYKYSLERQSPLSTNESNKLIDKENKTVEIVPEHDKSSMLYLFCINQSEKTEETEKGKQSKETTTDAKDSSQISRLFWSRRLLSTKNDSGPKDQEINAGEVRDIESNSGNWKRNYIRDTQGEVERMTEERDSSSNFAVSPITTSPDNHQTVTEKNDMPKIPDVIYVYPESARRSTVSPVTSSVMYVYPEPARPIITTSKKIQRHNVKRRCSM
ncbi:PREDICTED: uncharacterized protein LOC105454621 isoform X1 [Wasmannia auropunctata]|uniref:uncharacterized protein LOC105454621 isoform X1 n=1 Tax=Wasmannia auropunctata TaxID=64793 RepID=UPI0005EED9F0|nr:PREDICTED: uncharacterized protein LOC105454621 isoform X1 [Wasmannia auropunctata]